MSKEQILFEFLFSKMNLIYKNSEVLFGNLHIIDVSEEEYIDKFTPVNYRVYHSEGYCFDVVKKYESEAEDGGGGIVYYFFDDAFDGFKRIDIDTATKIITEFNPTTDNLFGRDKGR